MDLTTKQWLIGIIIVIIIVILIDGFRRMRKARRDSLHMSLDPRNTPSIDDPDVYGSEFPNGGARASQKSIDPDRIEKVKSQYDFGRDLNIPSQKSTTENTEAYSQDQWVDAEEGDEEYYANQWDDEHVDETEGHDDIQKKQDDDLGEIEPLPEASEEPEPLVADEVHDTKNAESEIDPIEEDESDLAEENTIVEQESNTSKKVSTELFQVLDEDEDEEEVISSENDYQTPTQVPLNLEESVPVLMLSLIHI